MRCRAQPSLAAPLQRWGGVFVSGSRNGGDTSDTARSVTGVEVTGLAALRRRLEAASAPEAFKQALREEAEAIAAEARREAPGELARTIDVVDVSKGERLGFAIGTTDPAGLAAEFGTLNFGRFSARVYQRLRTGSENSRWRL